MATLHTTLAGTSVLLADAVKQKIEAAMRAELHDAVDKAKAAVLADLEPILQGFVADLMVRLDMIREVDSNRVVLQVRIDGANE